MLTKSLNLLRAPGASSVLTRSTALLSCERAAIRPGFKTKPIALVFTAVLICSGPHYALAVNAAGQSAPAPATLQPEEHGPWQKAVEIARPFGFPITNSMIASWIVASGLIGFAQVATRHMKLVPDGIQNFWEWLIEGLYTFLEGIIGSHLVQLTFWFFASVFIFILTANWLGLIPGVGTIGWGHRGSHGFIIDHPLFRGANADVNLTFAMAMVSKP
jgi:F-type H+-transporting ATPase subunit a